MRIIRSTLNSNGAYPPIQTWEGSAAPEGYYQVADNVELSCGGFGTLTVAERIVAGWNGDESAWNAWLAEHPKPEEPVDDITQLQLAMAELAELITGVES